MKEVKRIYKLTLYTTLPGADGWGTVVSGPTTRFFASAEDAFAFAEEFGPLPNGWRTLPAHIWSDPRPNPWREIVDDGPGMVVDHAEITEEPLYTISQGGVP